MTMVVVTSLVGFAILFQVAWALRKRRQRSATTRDEPGRWPGAMGALIRRATDPAGSGQAGWWGWVKGVPAG
ncbi:MAG TPA: hypothetical protein VFX61_17315 [Micromonosporaceae bacterium]|nr:hypothetical protein [Micromonosporaceae bacterium]